MSRIWEVKIEGLDRRNFTGLTVDAVLKKAQRFLAITRRDFDQPKAQITEIRLIAEA